MTFQIRIFVSCVIYTFINNCALRSWWHMKLTLELRLIALELLFNCSRIVVNIYQISLQINPWFLSLLYVFLYSYYARSQPTTTDVMIYEMWLLALSPLILKYFQRLQSITHLANLEADKWPIWMNKMLHPTVKSAHNIGWLMASADVLNRYDLMNMQQRVLVSWDRDYWLPQVKRTITLYVWLILFSRNSVCGCPFCTCLITLRDILNIVV